MYWQPKNCALSFKFVFIVQVFCLKESYQFKVKKNK